MRLKGGRKGNAGFQQLVHPNQQQQQQQPAAAATGMNSDFQRSIAGFCRPGIFKSEIRGWRQWKLQVLNFFEVLEPTITPLMDEAASVAEHPQLPADPVLQRKARFVYAVLASFDQTWSCSENGPGGCRLDCTQRIRCVATPDSRVRTSHGESQDHFMAENGDAFLQREPSRHGLAYKL